MYALRPDLDPSTSSLLFLKNKAPKPQLEKCDHSKKVHAKSRLNCFSCGCHLSKNADVKTYKTMGFSYKVLMDIDAFCLALLGKKLLKETLLKPTHPYSKSRVSLIEMIFKLCENLHLSQNTTQMAVTYMDYIVLKGYIPSGQYNIYATTAVMLAAKAVELDQRIPFISSLRKYAFQDFKPEEIKRTEEIMLEILDWNTQFATLIDIVEYFLSQGVVFSNDSVNLNTQPEIKEISNLINLKKHESQTEKTQKFPSRIEKSKSMMETHDNFHKSFHPKQANTNENEMDNYTAIKDLTEKQLEDLVNKMEKEAKRLTNILIKDSSFLESNIKFVAGALIAFIRKKFGFKDLWNEELSILSNGIKEVELLDDLNKIISKLDQNGFTSIENEPKTIRRHRNTIYERKDVYKKINSTTENEKSFAPLNTSNVENQYRNTVLLKNPVNTTKLKPTVKIMK